MRVQQRLLARAGVNTDVELAVFESDHGDPARGLRLARRAWAAAPSVRSADALGWALTRSGRREEGLGWARRARRLGSADPLFAFHAGMAARGWRAAAAAAVRARARARGAAVAGEAGAGGAPMRRALLLFVVLFAALAAPAGAHPLGNFSINHVAEVSVSADRVDVRYLLDQAEIPTFQARGIPRAEQVRRARAEVLRRLRVEADGRPLTLTPGTPRLELRPGAGGLETTRFELALSARVRARRSWCATARSPAGSGGARSSRGPARAPRCAPACPPRTRRAASPATRATLRPPPPTSAPRGWTCGPERAPWRRPDGRPAGPGDAKAPGAEQARRRPRRRGGLRRPLRGRRLRRGRADPAAARRVRVGGGARALPRPRQDHGRRLPRRHARDREARGRARRDGDGHAHGRRAAARRRRAHAVGVRAARAAVPVAEPRLGPARGGGRRRGAALAGAEAEGALARAPPPTITTTRRTSPRAASSRWARRPG